LLQEQQGKDEVTLNEPDLEKPEKPKPATVDDARQRIIEKYNNIRRLPGLLPCSVWKSLLLWTFVLTSVNLAKPLDVLAQCIIGTFIRYVVYMQPCPINKNKHV